MYCEPSGIATSYAKVKGLNFAVMPMPTGARGTAFTCGGIGLIAVANIQHQNRLQKTMAAAKDLTDAQVQLDVPGYYTAPPARKSVQISAPASDFWPLVASTGITPMIGHWPAIRVL